MRSPIERIQIGRSNQIGSETESVPGQNQTECRKWPCNDRRLTTTHCDDSEAIRPE